LWPFKRQEPVLKPVQVIRPKDAEQALLATRKEAEQKARQKVKEELDELEFRNRNLESQLEQKQQYLDHILNAITQASEQQWLTSVRPAHETWRQEKAPPELIYYNTTLLDYETKLVAIGDATPIQQAAALYKASKEKGWEETIFSGVNEAQIEWLVKVSMKDGYAIDFEEDWAKEHAARIRAELQANSPDRAIEDDRRPGW
ncbi:hypothetical protein D6779_09790, partial [Candidatus Parcubacteria bacterium]